MSSTVKAKLKAFGTISNPRRVVELDLNGDKLALEIRAPSMLEKSEIAKAAGASQERPEGFDQALLGAHLLVRCAYEPHGGPAFTAEDVPDLIEMGPLLDPVYKVAFSLFNAPDDPAGKSGPTPS